MFLVLGRGTDQLLYCIRYDPAHGWLAPAALPGALRVFGFSAEGRGPRVNVYAVGQDLSAHAWATNDGGATWEGPTPLGGSFSSGLLAFGP